MSVNEMLPDPENILGMDGIEFIEYSTKQPQQFCMLLEKLGFVMVARHRSREVLLFKQGDMNLIVNSAAEGVSQEQGFSDCPVISGIAFRVQNAHFAHQRAIALGGWPIETRASAMELNVPGIRSVGQSTIYFVDRYKDFSIYDVDFVKLPNVTVPPAVGGMNYFGLVQTAYEGCTNNWTYFYSKIFGFNELPPNEFFGILQKGIILQSPCKSFHIQIIEPPVSDVDWTEEYLRLGFGAKDILSVSKELHERGISFVDHEKLHTTTKGALTQPYLGGIQFELVNNASQAK